MPPTVCPAVVLFDFLVNLFVNLAKNGVADLGSIISVFFLLELGSGNSVTLSSSFSSSDTGALNDFAFRLSGESTDLTCAPWASK